MNSSVPETGIVSFTITDVCSTTDWVAVLSLRGGFPVKSSVPGGIGIHC